MITCMLLCMFRYENLYFCLQKGKLMKKWYLDACEAAVPLGLAGPDILKAASGNKHRQRTSITLLLVSRLASLSSNNSNSRRSSSSVRPLNFFSEKSGSRRRLCSRELVSSRMRPKSRQLMNVLTGVFFTDFVVWSFSPSLET